MTKKSQLLFDEHPLVINPKLAQMIGLNEAIVLQQVHYWVTLNEKAGKNLREDFTWTYNTYKEWNLQFPFWSLRTIKTVIANLERKGLLISGNFNKVKQDRTKWYRVSLDAYTLQGADIAPSEEADVAPAEGKNDPLEKAAIAPALPETNAKTNAETPSEIKKGEPSPVDICFMAIKAFYGFPDKMKQDPIPNYGKEGNAIKKMLGRGFTLEQIITLWTEKVKKRGSYVSMVWVNEDIAGAPEPVVEEDPIQVNYQYLNRMQFRKFIKDNGRDPDGLEKEAIGEWVQEKIDAGWGLSDIASGDAVLAVREQV